MRGVRPGGQLIVAFTNHLIFQKAPRIWNDRSDQHRLRYVAKVLAALGWLPPRLISEATQAECPLGWLGGQGDPFLTVIAVKPASGDCS